MNAVTGKEFNSNYKERNWKRVSCYYVNGYNREPYTFLVDFEVKKGDYVFHDETLLEVGDVIEDKFPENYSNLGYYYKFLEGKVLLRSEMQEDNPIKGKRVSQIIVDDVFLF